MSINDARVTLPGAKVRSGSDSGDTSSSTSILGYNLASWGEQTFSRQQTAGDTPRELEIGGEDQGVGSCGGSASPGALSSASQARDLHSQSFPRAGCCWKGHFDKVSGGG